MKSMVKWSFSVVLIVTCRIKDLPLADKRSVNVHEASQCTEIYQCNDNCAETYQEAAVKCSCHPYCELFRDCCYNSEDYEHRCHNQNGPDSFPFDVFSQFVNYFQCTLDIITSEKYWMVSKCPQSWNGLNQCEDGQNVVGRLEENLSSIPVVSSNGITFKNIYCALCHGEDLENITPWSFQGEKCLSDGDSQDMGTNSTIRDKVHVLKENCETISFRPPADHMYRSISMIPCREVKGDVVDTCGESFPVTENSIKCPTVAAPLKVGRLIFKNKFCAECFYESIRETVTIYEVCLGSRGPASGRTDCNLVPPPRRCICQNSCSHQLVPISITFDFGGPKGRVSIKKDKKNVEVTTVTCAIGQVFDPFASSCVHLSCPKDYMMSGDRCVHFSMVKSNDSSWPCKEFELQIDILPTKEGSHFCESNLEQVYACLPHELSLLLQTNVEYNNISCQTYTDGTKLTLRMLSPSLKVIEMIFNVSVDSSYYSNSPQACESFDFIIISGQCILHDVKNGTWECEQKWHNASQWHFEGTNQRIVFRESCEELSLSEVKFQRNFSFGIQGSVSETVLLKRCSFQHTKAIICSYILLNETLFQSLENGSETLVYVHDGNFKFSPEEYVRYSNGTIHVCNFFNVTGEVGFVFYPKYHTVLESILSTIGICLSMFALSITLLTYSVFPSLRTRLANIIIMNLCACLIIAQMLLLFAGLATTSQQICAAVAGFGHFFWIAVFSTSSVLGFLLNRTFTGLNETFRGEKPSKHKSVLYISVCFGGPAIVSGTLLILFLTNGNYLDITYGTMSGCWIGGSVTNLCAFGVPVAFFLVVNFYFFCHVTMSLFKKRRSCQRIIKTNKRKQMQELLVYAKIFMVLGLTWLIGYLAAFTKAQFLWYIFTILTSLQGVFIFLAFTFNSRIWIMWKDKLNGLAQSSNSTLLMRSLGKSK